MAAFLTKISVQAMSNLRPDDTGIAGVVLWVSAGEFEGKDKHEPRVKVIVGGGKVNAETLAAAPSVTILGGKVLRGKISAKILKQVQVFLVLNKDILLQYWNQTIGTKAMVNSLQEIESGK